MEYARCAIYLLIVQIHAEFLHKFASFVGNLYTLRH